jgi:protoporphyrin/coproporphyrin ferrochelatase
MNSTYDAVLLIAFGGPTSSEEIRPFLARVTKGIAIPPERLEGVAHHYEAVGGRSPLNDITFRQAEALQNLLQRKGAPLPVYVGMRNAAPCFAETLKQMAEDGVKRALGFILSSHRNEASWDRYQKNIADTRAELGEKAPEVEYCAGWHDHPLFIRTWVELIHARIGKIPPQRQRGTPLVFTAHSIPIGMADGSPYVDQLQVTAHLIAQGLTHQRWSIAYQSRSGKPADPWLEPDIKDVLRKLRVEHVTDVVVAPIGFVCDHVEVLYDLDIETKKTAEDLGINFIRASCPNDYPTFIQMMADVIEQKL